MKEKNKEYEIINLDYEYPGYKGVCTYAIISDLPEKVMLQKYEKELNEYAPFVYLTNEQGEAIRTYRKNEHKHEMRQLRRGDKYAYEDSTSEEHHRELIADDLFELVVASLEREQIRDAINTLTDVQKRRVYLYFFEGMTEREIAQKEGVCHKAVEKSLTASLEKIKKFLLQGRQNDSLGGNR